MGFDLAKALHKKAEAETARLQRFGFAQRARAISLLARQHGLDPKHLAAECAVLPDDELVNCLARRLALPLAETTAALAAAGEEARLQLIAELGNPAAHRLA